MLNALLPAGGANHAPTVNMAEYQRRPPRTTNERWSSYPTGLVVPSTRAKRAISGPLVYGFRSPDAFRLPRPPDQPDRSLAGHLADRRLGSVIAVPDPDRRRHPARGLDGARRGRLH